ncbi:MAG: exosortase/archaeosortase family protein [Nibricoccus sp.]
MPLRVINEANPDWVKVNVYLTCLTAGFSLSALYAMGRLRYVWHFAFPIFFVFTALPWPVQIEENIVQTLTRWNTLVSADTLTLCGIPAINRGNLIQIGETWVNVAEACSGIRSLQTSFMMPCLGEFYRLNIFLRALLMASSFAVAFILNIARTTTLTYIAGTRGDDVMEKSARPCRYCRDDPLPRRFVVPRTRLR